MCLCKGLLFCLLLLYLVQGQRGKLEQTLCKAHWRRHYTKSLVWRDIQTNKSYYAKCNPFFIVSCSCFWSSTESLKKSLGVKPVLILVLFSYVLISCELYLQNDFSQQHAELTLLVDIIRRCTPYNTPYNQFIYWINTHFLVIFFFFLHNIVLLISWLYFEKASNFVFIVGVWYPTL